MLDVLHQHGSALKKIECVGCKFYIKKTLLVGFAIPTKARKMTKQAGTIICLLLFLSCQCKILCRLISLWFSLL